MNKLRCVVIEDEVSPRLQLIKYLKSFEEIAVVGDAESVDSAFRLIVSCKPDCAFLDIKLIGGDAFLLLNRLKMQGIKMPSFVIVTAFQEYAIQAINEYHAHIVYYLVKPFGQDWHNNLRRALDAFFVATAASLNITSPIEPLKPDAQIQVKEHNNDFTFIKNQKSFIKIDINEVSYLEAAGSGSTYVVYDNSKCVKVNQTISKCLEDIFGSKFIRISKANAVNIKKINCINQETKSIDIVIEGKKRNLPIGMIYYKTVLTQMVNK